MFRIGRCDAADIRESGRGDAFSGPSERPNVIKHDDAMNIDAAPSLVREQRRQRPLGKAVFCSGAVVRVRVDGAGK